MNESKKKKKKPFQMPNGFLHRVVEHQVNQLCLEDSLAGQGSIPFTRAEQALLRVDSQWARMKELSWEEKKKNTDIHSSLLPPQTISNS